MHDRSKGRRAFIRMSGLGLGALAFDPVAKEKIVHAGKILKVVCLGAHPGDPEFGCGGTMARYSDAGHLVTLLYVTKGGSSDPSSSYAHTAALRVAEATEACRYLKATALFAGQEDGNTILDKRQNATIGKMIQGLQPDVVFSQWPLDGHPDHQVTGMLALNAWVQAKRSFDLYFYEVNTGSETMAFTPTDYVDITGVQDRKKQAMFAHKTQDPVETYNNYFLPLETFRGLEAGVKAAEAFIHFKTAAGKSTLEHL